MIPNKLVETAFRRWYLLILPMLLVPALIAVLTPTSPKYRSTATVWVTKPANIDGGSLSRNANPYLTTAQNQAQVIGDLMQTRSFREAVAAGVPGMSRESSNVVATSVSISALGTNLVGVNGTASTPERAQALVNSVLTQYQQRAAEESQRESTVVIDYYTEQLAPAQAELAKRESALTSYAQGKSIQQLNADPTYAALSSSVDAQNTVVQGILNTIQTAQLTALSGPESEKALFNVVDAPRLPAAALPVSAKTKVGYPFAGLLFGALIGTAYIYVLFRTDHTIRTSQDLNGLNVPVLGFVPNLSAPRHGPLGLVPGWLPGRGNRDFARQVAASISGSD